MLAGLVNKKSKKENAVENLPKTFIRGGRLNFTCVLILERQEFSENVCSFIMLMGNFDWGPILHNIIVSRGRGPIPYFSSLTDEDVDQVFASISPMFLWDIKPKFIHSQYNAYDLKTFSLTQEMIK